MDVIPPVRMARFEQIDPGDLFLHMDWSEKFFAIKTQAPANGDRNQILVLGPGFVRGGKGSMILPWQGANVLSFGKNYSVLLPADPLLWSLTQPDRRYVSLAVAEDKAYVCTNGGHSPEDYFPCFVDAKTGEVLRHRPSSAVAFTNSWEIAILGGSHPPRSILQYPLQGPFADDR